MKRLKLHQIEPGPEGTRVLTLDGKAQWVDPDDVPGAVTHIVPLVDPGGTNDPSLIWTGDGQLIFVEVTL